MSISNDLLGILEALDGIALESGDPRSRRVAEEARHILYRVQEQTSSASLRNLGELALRWYAGDIDNDALSGACATTKTQLRAFRAGAKETKA